MIGMRYRELVEGRDNPLDNPAFRDWFGNSRVVDSSGRPLVVYHGTTGDYTSLKLSSEGALGAGIYLTPNAEFAGNYARGVGANIIPVYVSLRNPLIIDSGRDDPMIYALVKLGVDRVRAVRVVERAYDEHGYIRRQVMTRALGAGYDGLIQYRDGRIAEIVAYNPSQVKSAIGNSGGYSRADRSMVGEGGIREDTNRDDGDSLRERNFKKTREAQRYGFGVVGTRAPEDIGVNFKYGPILQALLEHIGDLVNRAALPSEDIGYGLEAIGEKVRRGLFYLKSDYSTNEVIAQMERTGLYFIRQGEFADIEEFNRAADRELQEYVNAYSQIPVFTELQRLCREAAIEIGSLNLWRAAYTLRRIERIIDSPDAKDAYDRMEEIGRAHV